MTKYLRYLVSLVLICSTVFATGTKSHAQENITIKIGAIASLTGPASEHGRNWLEGAQVAVKELATEGITVQLLVEDDATNGSKAAAAFKKLTSVDKVQGMIGGTWDYTAKAVFAVAQQEQMPFITPSNPIEVFGDSAKDNRYIFTLGLSVQAAKDRMRRFIENAAPKSIAIVVPKLPFGTTYAGAIEEIAKEKDVPIVFREDFDLAEYHQVLRSIALKLTRIKAELIFCISDYAGFDIFVTELQKYKLAPTILTTQHLAQAVAYSKNPKRYQNSFGIYPNNPSPEKVFMSEGNASVKILAQGILKGGDYSADWPQNLSKQTAVILHPDLSGNMTEVK